MSIAPTETAVRSHPSTIASHRAAVERVIRTMRERMSEELSLEEMADVALMSTYHFNRTFRQLTGIPPSQFLSALRLEAAKRLLLTTGRSVTDICYEVGYNSLGTFTTRFTQLVGLPPGQLRRLSEAFTGASAEELLTLSQSPQEATGPAITGRIEGDSSVSGLLFLGLFEKPIPQERPLSCAILAQPGPYRIEIPGDGDFFVFAAGLAHIEKPLDYLMCGGSIRGLAHAGPLSVHDGEVTGDADMTLEPPKLLNPPLLVTLPLLIDERLAREFGAEAGDPDAVEAGAVEREPHDGDPVETVFG
ncbi:MAG: helix-turn-helix transcriptional regulator [bacterium]|nr:helix-turn-helix transcriptional regulator [bacterium]